MADYNYIAITAEDIENLLLSTAIHSNSPEGQRAIQALTNKYKRMDSERSRRALWISIIALVISLVGLVVNAFGAEDRYLCVADMASGFYFDSSSKSYKQTHFDVRDNKYIVSKSELKYAELELRKVGQKAAVYLSPDGFSPDGGLAYFRNSFMGEFRVSKRTGRYIHVYMMGYVTGDSEGNTPFIEIGKCSPF